MARRWVYNGVEFKVGDKVRVVRFEEDFAQDGMGEGLRWDNTWCMSMDEVFRFPCDHTISAISMQGVMFDEVGVWEFMYPLSSLEKI